MIGVIIFLKKNMLLSTLQSYCPTLYVMRVKFHNFQSVNGFGKKKITYTSAVSIRNLRWLICEGPNLKFLRSFSLSLAPNEPHRGTAFSVSSSGFSEAADVVVVVMRSSNFSTEPNKRVGKMSFLEVLQKKKSLFSISDSSSAMVLKFCNSISI